MRLVDVIKRLPHRVFLLTPSLEGWPTKVKEAPSPYEVRLTLLVTNPVFKSLGENNREMSKKFGPIFRKRLDPSSSSLNDTCPCYSKEKMLQGFDNGL